MSGNQCDVTTLHRRWFEPEPTTTPTATTGRTAAPLVLLHEGLGSISAWGSFPARLAAATGRRVLAYDRRGYGQSPPWPAPWPAEYMHHEAVILADLLAAEGLDEVVLVGHSDGGTIALLYPAEAPDGSATVAGIVSLSAHVFVEEVGVEAITGIVAGYENELRSRLARHHADVDATFEGWSDVWLSDRFRPWTIDADLAAVTCPVLALQGAADLYGTDEQVDRIAAAVTGPATVELLEGVDHWPHREAPDEVITLVVEFLRNLG